MLFNRLKQVSLMSVVISLYLFLFVNTVSAMDWEDQLTFNGYYTLDYTYVDDDLNLASPSARRDFKKNKSSFDNSIIGGQLKFDFTDAISVFIQGSLTIDNKKSTQADFDWAYLSYDFGNDLKARIGKFQMPLLSGIELRKISYSRLWARPLIPGNGASGYDYYKGIDVIKNIATENANWDFQFGAGVGHHNLNEVDNKNIKLISARYERDNYWIRAALMSTQYRLFTPRNLLLTDSGESLLASLESEININQFQINLGLSNSDAKIVPDDAMAYLSLAYQFDNFTPYVYGVKLKQHFPAPAQPQGGTPPGNPPPVAGGPPVGNINTYNTAIGVRWDVRPRMAIKFQLENVREQNESRIQQNGIVSKDGNALTIILEGVF